MWVWVFSLQMQTVSVGSGTKSTGILHVNDVSGSVFVLILMGLSPLTHKVNKHRSTDVSHKLWHTTPWETPKWELDLAQHVLVHLVKKSEKKVQEIDSGRKRYSEWGRKTDSMESCLPLCCFLYELNYFTVHLRQLYNITLYWRTQEHPLKSN